VFTPKTFLDYKVSAILSSSMKIYCFLKNLDKNATRKFVLLHETFSVFKIDVSTLLCSDMFVYFTLFPIINRNKFLYYKNEFAYHQIA